MTTSPTPPQPKKLCFLTVGATAPFDALITASLSGPFLAALRAASYTDLLLQHGSSAVFAPRAAAAAGQEHGLTVQGFEFNREGLGREMRAAKGTAGGVEGCVVSHAGSGSILDALRLGVPLIVVPNPALLDNHQAELAEELAAQGYVVYGKLGDLAAAVGEVEALGKRQKAWPPAGRGGKEEGRGLVGVMDDEMGFVD
ncbi:N-acetylglucosaminyldiphosphodolichol N-acetylglucosaminyltransferase catalytic subunit alg13 [Xylographa trunciseda]|nr:N-acetylglucosaminyldiphosphodolichol N-acetylglucosaminyltransferase catalytic subunit alg13 [Xylographa trunciseda]